MRRLPGAGSGQSAVSRAGRAVVAGRRPRRQHPALAGRGSCRRGWARRPAMASCRPAPSKGSALRLPRTTAGSSGSGAVSPASSMNGRRRGRRTRRRSRRRCAGGYSPAKSGGVGLEARRCRRRPSGRVAGTSQWERGGRARAGREGLVGQERPGSRPRGGGGRCGPASSGRRERSAMPPWPGNLPQPQPSPHPVARPSPSRSRNEGSPALTWAWKARGSRWRACLGRGGRGRRRGRRRGGRRRCR